MRAISMLLSSMQTSVDILGSSVQGIQCQAIQVCKQAIPTICGIMTLSVFLTLLGMLLLKQVSRREGSGTKKAN